MMMFKAIRKFGAAALALAWFLSPTAADAATACGTSAASLNGWYAMLITGGNVSAGTPKYQVGAILFNGAGGLSGSHVYASNGAVSAATGTYVQNADCSFTVFLTVGSTLSTYTVAIKTGGEAVGIEVDATSVANISFKPQYATVTTGLNFTAASANGSWAASCSGPLSSSSDLNLVTFANGSISGTDPFNNAGTFVSSNVPYTGTYTLNTDGTFAGALVVEGTNFDYYGVLGTSNTEIEYIYENVANGAPTTAFAACVGGLAQGTTSTVAPFTLSAASNPFTLKQNTGGTDAITVTDAAGFTGAVTLSVAGLPAGASAAFSGNSLVIFPSFTTAVGTYPLTVTGTSGASTATLALNLSITAGANFSLSPASTSLTVARGKSGTDALTVKPVNGFTGSVTFSASGLPAGATASFSPASSTTASTVTIAAASTTTPGTYTVSIAGTAAATGSSNSFSSATTVTLVVQ